MSGHIYRRWSCTRSNVINLQFVWTIDNFSLYGNNTKSLRSATFASNSGFKDIKWQLELCPKGLQKDKEDYVSLYLEACNLENDMQVSFTFAILDCKDQKHSIVKHEYLFAPRGPIAWGSQNFISRETLFNNEIGLLQDDRLTVSCDINYLSESWNVTSDIPVYKPDNSLSKDLERVFEGQQFTDVIFLVDGREICAHKAILAERSEVFRAMFSHDMAENISNRVEIPDVKFVVMRELLRFIYSERAAKLDLLSRDLLIVADKYAVENLKRKCEQVLSSNLNSENAAELLLLAEAHNSPELRARCIDYITGHIGEVIATDGWQVLAKSQPLSAEIFMASAVQKAKDKSNGDKCKTKPFKKQRI